MHLSRRPFRHTAQYGCHNFACRLEGLHAPAPNKTPFCVCEQMGALANQLRQLVVGLQPPQQPTELVVVGVLRQALQLTTTGFRGFSPCVH